MQPNNSPSPDYEFILKDNPTAKRSLIPNFPKTTLVVIGAIVSLMLLILIYGIFFRGGSGGAVDNLIGSMGRAQEISRISSEQQPNLKDPSIVSLAATVSLAASSDQAQINKYLKKQGVKVDQKKLAVYKTNNKEIDTKLEQAVANNTIDIAYINYLKSSLADYSNILKKAYNESESVATKDVVKSIFDSTQILLTTSALGT
jgi:hypothetical protein